MATRITLGFIVSIAAVARPEAGVTGGGLCYGRVGCACTVHAGCRCAYGVTSGGGAQFLPYQGKPRNCSVVQCGVNECCAVGMLWYFVDVLDERGYDLRLGSSCRGMPQFWSIISLLVEMGKTLSLLYCVLFVCPAISMKGKKKCIPLHEASR